MRLPFQIPFQIKMQDMACLEAGAKCTKFFAYSAPHSLPIHIYLPSLLLFFFHSIGEEIGNLAPWLKQTLSLIPIWHDFGTQNGTAPGDQS